MKNSFLLISLRAKFLLALMFVSLGFFSAFSQKDILLYSTDFTDWTAVAYSGTSSNAVAVTTGKGAGFTLTSDMTVDPTTGKLWVEGSTSGRDLVMPAFNFLTSGGGGVIELEYEMTGSGSARAIGISGGTVTQASIDAFSNTSASTIDYTGLWAGSSSTSLAMGTSGTAKNSIDVSKLGILYPGATAQICKVAVGRVKVSLYLPGLSGSTALSIVGLRQDLPLRSIKVYASVGSKKYVASTDYVNCTDDPTGVSLSGVKGSTTSVSKNVNVKAWNVTGPITMSITGTDAAKFSLPVTSVVNADALLGKSIAVNFTPSVMNGVSKAQLILSSVGAPDYCINLTGLTSSGASPEITTSTATIPFYTGLISTSTQTVDISGVNLTGPVTLSLTGTNASQFSLSTTTVSLADALAGKGVDIIYQGAIGAVTQNANLVISSAGATSVTIPLVGRTYSYPPTLYTLTKIVTPGGTGIITQDLAGSTFASGVTVKVTAVPESGYKFDHWSDNNSTVAARSVLMTENKNITAVFVVGTPPTSVTAFKAYTPSTIANTSFTARWSTVTSATGYTITVYDQTGAVVGTPKVVTGGSTASVSITGLTAGSLYTYKVVATGTGDISNIAGPIQTTGTAPVPACGSN